ncbi:MAG: hypothetical protein DWH91_01610 [Planctomycetota bacterium]|nr:MAG: hypothetical protein DWH91_01610 [Planctomycetota bacterium]
MKLGLNTRQSSRLVVLLAIALLSAWPIIKAVRRSQLQTLVKRCQEAVQQQDWILATPLAEEWASRAPDDAEAWITLADIAKAQGDLEATAECLRRIPSTDTKYVQMQLLRADLMLNALQRPYDAIDTLKMVLAAEPGNPVAHQRIIYIYSMTMQREALAQQIREAIRHRAEPPEAYGYLLAIPNLIFSDGYLRVEKWLKSSPEDETLQVAYAIFRERTNAGRGIRDFGTGQSESPGETPFEAALKQYPNNLELRAYRIDSIIAQADMPALSQALQNLPPNAERDSRYWRFIATYQDSQRLPQDAAESLNKAIELHPLDWKAHHEMGTIARVLGRTEEAIRHADLGARGKLLERRVFELANASQADPPLLRAILRYAKDCGDADAVSGLTHRLQEMDELDGPE